ncbi:Uu.00g020720.m01.CDS01 [Anthostomella pinea]|uniref:Uu.00g020720.m01.CDS01 n=1 Tax=Anthostomella pinea TaxID=933095 RepID=A0AAI8YQS7_9PEZI|nr:Uu.00g020720.m01.CDS01 [Anthostomella pinea]
MESSITATAASPEATARTIPGEKNGGNDAVETEVSMGDDIDPADEVRGLKLVVIHLAICLCTFLVGLDFNLIATAVPVITTEFGSTRDIGWYGATFMVAMCASQPLAGKIYTLFPKKTTYLMYLFVFELGSLVCALSPSSHALIAGRAVAGLGASGLLAGAFTIITTIIPLHKRANVTWRWCFYINLPIGGAAAAIFFFLVHIRPAETANRPIAAKLQSLDALGLALFAGSITMLLLALQWGDVEYAWSSSVIIGLFVAFGLTMILFVFWTLHRQENALIPPRIFTVNRNPALLCAAAFFVNGPFQVIIYWLPIWFQGVLGVSPTRSGVNFFPTVVSDVLAAFIGSAMVTQIGWWNPFLIVAEAFVCIGGGLLTTIYPEISAAHWIGYQIFGGIGYSLASNLSHLAMQSSLPQDLVPLGASTLLSVISTSCAIFMAIGQTVFQKQLQANLGAVVSEDLVEKIIDAGVTNIGSLVDASELSAIIHMYSKSVTQVFYIPASAPAIAFILLLGCKWISTKSKQSAAVVAESGETKNAD